MGTAGKAHPTVISQAFTERKLTHESTMKARRRVMGARGVNSEGGQSWESVHVCPGSRWRIHCAERIAGPTGSAGFATPLLCGKAMIPIGCRRRFGGDGFETSSISGGMRISNKMVAYALLRVAVGVNFLGHGVFRILSGTGKFAAMMADSMAKSPLPHGLTVGFLSAVPVTETVLGVALILGLVTRVTLVGGAMFMWALTFGVTSNQQWDVAGQQLLYSLVFFVLLFAVEFNGLAVDGLLGRKTTGV